MEDSNIWPVMSTKMTDSVTEVLKSGKLNQWNNPTVKDFETKFAKYMNCNYAVAVFNGTVALELCIKTLKLKEGDEIIVTPRTFLASASCCAWYGITPVFVDVDMNSQNITLETIKLSITEKTKAIILVHLAGWPCDLEEICNYGREKGIYIIEDCAQAHGAKYNGKSVGTWGDINAWSFCQDKIITTGGEGGMVTTNCPHLYKLAWSLKDHGKGFDTVYNKEHPPGFRWLHENIGTNWRMMPMQAVIGSHALDELYDWVKHRRKIGAIYNDTLKDCAGVRITLPPENVYHAYYKYYFFIEPAKFKVSRDDLICKINIQNIFCQVGSCSEVYKEEALKQYAPKDELPVTQNLFKTALLLLCDPCISEEVAFNNITKIKQILVNNYSTTSFIKSI
jgi:dTDP-4-amino-4,6-dideoxygalactose transaminase